MSMEIFTMKCPKCGRIAPPSLILSEGKILEVKDESSAPSNMCICGAVSKLPLGTYRSTEKGIIKES